MDSEHFSCPFGSYQLHRLPLQKQQPLRAWDAADEYLLSHLHNEQLLTAESRVLIVNDSFGALSINLHAYSIQNWSDSFISHQACRENFQHNQINQLPTLVQSTDAPQGTFNIVLIKIPKTVALLEDQLIRLKPLITADTRIIGAAMLKHLPKSAIQLFEKILGTSHTSLAQKKARLIFSRMDNTSRDLQPPYPKCDTEPTTQITLCQHANVFSKDKLDIGTRFFLEQFKKLPQAEKILDLGCGNGLLGIMAQKQQPQAKLSFIDESYMAVASARQSYSKSFPDKPADFFASNVLSQFSGKVDLVICNPPFHQQHSTGDFIAWQMFVQSQQSLEKSGELWIVGNRHLNYHSKLKKLFGSCDFIASNKKFVALRAQKK